MQILIITLLGDEPGKEPYALEHRATNPGESSKALKRQLTFE